MTGAAATIEAVFRREHGRIIATLIRLSGSFDLAEEALQDAFTSALQDWAENGIPRNPAAWITTAAHRKLIDRVRRSRTVQEKQAPLLYETQIYSVPDDTFLEEGHTFPDDRLRLIFTCCHPALNLEAQVGLTLRTLCGLTTPEIARAFLMPEPTLAQRIVRAKRKIRDAGIPYEVPPLAVLPQRLASVQSVIYLVFNEGYSATEGDQLIRRDLCQEAIRLGKILCEILPDQPESMGLLALMLLQDSRRRARINDQGNLVTLEEQDRSLWDQGEIKQGQALVERALRKHAVGPYQLQAAIAAVHAEAATAAETDWSQISGLYTELERISPTPVVALNRAVAVAMSEGLERGLALIDEAGLTGELSQYHLFYAARADILRRLGRGQEAAEAYEQALRFNVNRVEREYLRRRLTELTTI